MDEFNKDPFNEEKNPRDYNPQYQQNYNYNQQNLNQQGYVPPQQNVYGYQQYTPYPQQPGQGMAIASLVLGIISIVFSLITAMFPFFFLVPIIGIILGALHKSKHLPIGKGLSTAGIVTSIVGIVLTLLIYVACFALLAYLANDPQISEMMRDSMNTLKEMSPEDYETMYEVYGEMYPEWFSESMKFISR